MLYIDNPFEERGDQWPHTIDQRRVKYIARDMEVAAEKFGAIKIIDPRKCAVGSIKSIFKKYYHLDRVLPAMGYSNEQIKELEKTINACDCELVIIGTPIDISRILHINKPTVRVSYELEEIGKPDLTDVLKEFLKQ